MPDWSIEIPSREELELMQLERLQSTLNRAYRRVKFYRRQFDQRDLRADDIQDLSQLAKLPFTTRADLSQNYPYGLFAVPFRDVVRIQSSPGTTENPVVVGYTAGTSGSGGNSAPASTGAPMSAKTISSRLFWPAV